MLAFLALSLALHALVGGMARLFTGDVPERSVKRRYDAVRLRVALIPEHPPPAAKAPKNGSGTEGPPPRPYPLRRVGKRPEASTAPADVLQAPSAAPIVRNKLQNVERYTDLLPGADWTETEDEARNDEHNDPGRSGVGGGRHTMPQAIEEAAEEFSGRFDIPLVFRENQPQAKAVAKVVQREDHTFYFESVDGEPLLRAVLFEAIRTAKGRAQILELFRRLRSSELMIVLSQTTTQGSQPTAWTDESYRVDGHKLVIQKVTTLGRMGSGVIPDEDWRRARRRDAAAVTRLEGSPAFISPLRDRDLDP